MEAMNAALLEQQATMLNEQQQQMLKLFKNPLPEEDYKIIKREILFLKAKMIDAELEKWEKENNITADDYERWSNEHFRTPYKHQ